MGFSSVNLLVLNEWAMPPFSYQNRSPTAKEEAKSEHRRRSKWTKANVRPKHVLKRVENFEMKRNKQTNKAKSDNYISSQGKQTQFAMKRRRRREKQEALTKRQNGISPFPFLLLGSIFHSLTWVGVKLVWFVGMSKMSWSSSTKLKKTKTYIWSV